MGTVTVALADGWAESYHDEGWRNPDHDGAHAWEYSYEVDSISDALRIFRRTYKYNWHREVWSPVDEALEVAHYHPSEWSQVRGEQAPRHSGGRHLAAPAGAHDTVATTPIERATEPERVPTRCPNGHPLGPGQVIVGYGTRPDGVQAPSWTCRTCGAIAWDARAR